MGVKGDSFPKGAKGYRLWLDRGRRVKLEPDLSWWDSGRCVFVGDVKYKVTAGTGAKNPDAYQVLAYTVATGLETGLLIYAEGEVEEHVHDIQGVDKKIEVRTLDLSLEPDHLLTSIRSIADGIRVRSMRERPAA